MTKNYEDSFDKSHSMTQFSNIDKFKDKEKIKTRIQSKKSGKY